VRIVEKQARMPDLRARNVVRKVRMMVKTDWIADLMERMKVMLARMMVKQVNSLDWLVRKPVK
jgi:hypothetical protein